jgi:hypothetical protein
MSATAARCSIVNTSSWLTALVPFEYCLVKDNFSQYLFFKDTYIQFTSVKAFISIMHHKENSDWSMNTEQGEHTLHTNNATNVNRMVFLFIKREWVNTDTTEGS